jgi:hypothetical protein
MNGTLRIRATLAVAAVVIIGCGQSSVTPSGVESTVAPSPSPTVAAPTGTSPQPSATESGASAVAIPGEFTICIPKNRELVRGTDEQVAVPHPDGDMTIERQRGYTWSGTHGATDPRFSGVHYTSWDGDTYTLASGDEGPIAYAEGLRIENDEGAWQGDASGVTLPDGTSWTGPLVMTGEGAYEGLTAVLLGTDGPCFIDFRGLVIEFPDPPVPATTE